VRSLADRLKGRDVFCIPDVKALSHTGREASSYHQIFDEW
jgi:hypothetical protein